MQMTTAFAPTQADLADLWFDLGAGVLTYAAAEQAPFEDTEEIDEEETDTETDEADEDLDEDEDDEDDAEEDSDDDKAGEEEED